MIQGNANRGTLWIAVLALAIGLISSLITVAVFSGRLDARVQAIEQANTQRVDRKEWDQFALDIRSRLDRIENKLDKHMLDHK